MYVCVYVLYVECHIRSFELKYLHVTLLKIYVENS